jgi:hypothetical protein
MGQYYRAIYLGEESSDIAETILGWLEAYAYQNGQKLTEHSYIGNNYVSAFEYELRPGGKFYKSRVVWAGDYADNELSGSVIMNGKERTKVNLYYLCYNAPKLTLPGDVDTSKYPYVVNHTLREFVDKQKMPRMRDGLKFHPLPLLTCEGNGLGGGDYRGDDEEFIGIWSRNVISIEKEKPHGYNEVLFEPYEH